MATNIRPPYSVTIGTVSHGTLRREDLIFAFIDALDCIDDEITTGATIGAGFDDCEARKALSTHITDITSDIEARASDDESGYDAEYFDSEEAAWDLEQLEDLLNELAPPYVYFGAHEGDGSDFGFWVLWDSIEEDRSCEALASGDELPSMGKEEGELFLHISDHGNAELYQWSSGKWCSLWSIV